MTREQIVWRTPHPLWRTHGQGARFEEPAVLRFAGDDFMEQFEATLAGDGLDGLVAGHETWRNEGAGLGTDHEAPPSEPITLFQPTHGRFYLATASLVCRRYGHPDRRVAAERGETTGFLLRRLVPTQGLVDVTDADTFVEHGWISEAWRPVSNTFAHPHEQRLPLFAMTSTSGNGQRRLLAGLIPVSRREELQPPQTVRPDESSQNSDPLAVLADERLQTLEPLVAGLQSILTEDLTDDDVAAVARESLFFLMVDLAAWLDGPDHLPGSLEPGGKVAKLDTAFDEAKGITWRQALATALENESDAVFAQVAEPAPVAGLEAAEIKNALEALLPHGDAYTGPTKTAFFTQIHKALPERSTASEAAEVVTAPTADPADPNAVYVVRCLYERPQCRPAERHQLSRPSRPFRLAAFHEPDAPYRPVRIAFPVDTSPGGLRRFPKNVSMVLSSELRKQMERATPKTLRNGDVGTPPAISFGMICQLSIPIITICALILLMIIVQILNIVFFWLPLFKICLPIPKPKTE